MIRINENYSKLQASYLFSDIAKRVAAFQKANPGKDVIKLGIGDVTRPLPAACIKAFHKAVDEMAEADTFRGYGPEQGYDFLREAIAKHDYQARGAEVDADEIFVSDGSKCDTGAILDSLSVSPTTGAADYNIDGAQCLRNLFTGTDANAAGDGSSTAGLEDFIAFQSKVAPTAFEIGGYGVGEGQFSYPIDVIIDGTGRLYVADRANDRIQVWSY